MTTQMPQTLPTVDFDHMVDDTLFAESRSGFYDGGLKRALDVALVLLAALPVAILVGLVALLVARDGASPFYFQKRVGRGGRIFHMMKLRSMVPNADRLLDAYLADNPEARAEWDRDQKLRHDPRITPVGRLIRKTSLDELPQLWNVLRGDMSLVGPRPMMVEQQAFYPGSAYYALRPGITGLWQTSVRNEASFAERSFYDTEYLRTLSFATDLRILAKTVRVVIQGTGC